MAVITHAALETDLRLATVLSQEIALLLADRTSIRTTGAVTYFGSVNSAGSDTLSVSLAGLDGHDSMAFVADGVDLTATTDITDASAAIAVARYSIRRDLTDLAELSGGHLADISVERLAASAVGEAEKCFMGLVGTAIAGFGTDVGATGVDMSCDDFFAATAQLELSSNTGPFYCLLAPRQWADLQSSVRAEAGALQMTTSAQSALDVKPAGWVGEFLGVSVYTSSSVTAPGADCNGGMWAQGCLGYADAQPLISFGDTIRPSGSPVVCELQRDASAALTEVISSAFFGVSIIQDSMGVGIVTDAP